MGSYFEDLEVGVTTTSPRRTVTEADIAAFAGVSGDFNPLHTDDVFAASTPFGTRIAHGLLVLSIATGLRQRTGQFDGTLLAFLEVRSWRFSRAVRIGDTIDCVSEIAELRPTSKPDRGVVVQRVTVRDPDGEPLQSGEFVLLVRRRTGD